VGSVNVYGNTKYAFTGREEELADAFGVHVQAMIRQADLSQPPKPRAVVHPDLVEQAIIGEALDVLVATHGYERATVGRRLDEAAARARILPISAARAIQLGQPELQMQ
jgi:hypothetical protein